MLTDAAGYAITTNSRSTVEAVETFTTELLSHGQRAAVIVAAAEADRTCALAQALTGALYLFLQTGEGLDRAAPWLAAARETAVGATDRERMLIAALDAWHSRDDGRALTLHLEIARDWPRDLLNLKIAQIHQLNRGDRSGMRDLTTAAVGWNPGSGFAWGLHAFALEQAGDLAGAEAAGMKAVSMNADDPWAQHAVAHVREARGQAADGLAFLESMSPRWDRCSSFMYTHNWWHTALFRLSLGDAAGAIALFDTRVWGVRKTYVQDQVNAVSLLARLELRGVDVGDRWQDVADHVAPRIHDRLNAFHDLHTLYALARAGRVEAVAAMMEDMAGIDLPRLWRQVALPAARALAAHAAQRWTAATAIGSILPRLPLLGGSTAQQDWFQQLHRHAVYRAAGEEGRRVFGYRSATPAVPAVHALGGT
jgi:tetratricopeptide (TPR) repeat protein